MKKYNLIFLLVLCIVCVSCNQDKKLYVRDRIDLQGRWEFRIDSLNEGVKDRWYIQNFSDSVSLPGTLDTNKKGILNTKMDETTHLSREYVYTGKVWYKRSVKIPDGWDRKNIRMVLERTKPTKLWVDGKEIGANDNVSTSQIYDLTAYLSPGAHDIAIMVDNGESVPPQIISNSHAYTESTQTNWNGIIGDMYLEAANTFHIKDVQVYPDAKNKTVLVKIKFSDPQNIQNAEIELAGQVWNSVEKRTVEPLKQALDLSKNEVDIVYNLGKDALLWSEFHPALYRLDITLAGDKIFDSQSVNFGLRDFTTKGTQFSVNGNITFLRGKHDACVFPLTAHVAMDVETWRKYFQTAKQYGINHYRFHSWCPPKACFEAADIEGIYLQPELPFWGTMDKNDGRLISFLSKEGINIQNEFGNHASFVMFALGNELFGDHEAMDDLISTFRSIDSNRHLYAFGANNFLGYKGQIPGEDFLVTCRIGGASDDAPFSTHVRGSFSFADAYDGGYINHSYPNSEMNFIKAIEGCTVPVISHETGQFQVYPDYKEMKKYTGVLKPRNLEVFKKRLENAGMLDQADDFFKASGKWAVQLYKADIEMDLRTPGFGGFQLLDLQDYPGQGSAFVGVLDAFMDNKGLVTPEEWREFSAPVVPLFITEKFCWTSNESLKGIVKVANYSESSLKGKKIQWSLNSEKGQSLQEGSIDISSDKQGLLDLGEIRAKLSFASIPQKVILSLRVSDTEYKNTYPLWIYPEKADVDIPDDIVVTTKLDVAVISRLKQGGRVLWFPDRKEYVGSTVGGLFQTDYWNYRMFKTICENIHKPVSPGTLGILTNPKHPIFKDFPTEFHTSWQWFPIIKNSYPLIMDKMPATYRPIVQVIDNVERNHKLGLVFEFKVEKGSLLICMSDLKAAMDKPEVRQLYYSMINYMKSGAFNPQSKLDISSLNKLFSPVTPSAKIDLLENISYH